MCFNQSRMRGFITRRDYSLMQRANNWHAPRWVQYWMLLATRAGDGWLWAATGIGILLFGKEDRVRAVLAGSAAAGASVVLFRILKHLTTRPRPCDVMPHCWANLLPPDQFSFPSGHSMNAFAIAVAVLLFYPALTGALLFAAVSIAVSRIVLGMHFLSDVLVGSALGAGLGYAAYLLFD